MKVEKGRVVRFHYNLKLESGEQIESTFNHEPFSFIVGKNQIIPALEKGLLGMQVGEKREVKVEAKDGYGERDEKLFQVVNRNRIPPNINLQEGLVLRGNNKKGETVEVRVSSFDENQVVVDLNHPLAGETLNFETEIVKIREATPEELKADHVH